MKTSIGFAGFLGAVVGLGLAAFPSCSPVVSIGRDDEGATDGGAPDGGCRGNAQECYEYPGCANEDYQCPRLKTAFCAVEKIHDRHDECASATECVEASFAEGCLGGISDCPPRLVNAQHQATFEAEAAAEVERYCDGGVCSMSGLCAWVRDEHQIGCVSGRCAWVPKPDAGGDYSFCAMSLATAIDRVQISRTDSLSSRRVKLVLASPSPGTSGIVTPQGWGVESATLETPGSSVSATSSSGTVAFTYPDGGAILFPEEVDVHVQLDFAGVIERLDADSLAVGSDCFGQGGRSWSVVSGMTSVTTKDLHAVFASSSGRAMAVGSSNASLGWDGFRWQEDGAPISALADFKRVWSDGTDYWIIANIPLTAGYQAVALRRTPSDWNSYPLTSATAPEINGVWGSGPSDIWAVGRTVGSTGLSFRWDGASWGPAEQSARPMLGVTGTGPADVWIATDSGLMRFDGSQWATSPASPGPLTGGLWIRRSSPIDVWATGAAGKLYRFDGSAWATATAGTKTFNALWGATPDQAWAVGEGGALASFDGVTWLERTGPTTVTLHGIHGTATDDIWAVGEGGTILHFGDGALGSLCGSDQSCNVGLRCCYPCGVPDCHDRCSGTVGGACPAVP